MKVSENKVAFFDGLYRAAKEKQAYLFDRLDKAYAQYCGSKDTDGGRPAETVRNITYELIESQISTEIPLPTVSVAGASLCKERNARRVEALLTSLRDKLPFEKINDMDERYTYIYGGSVFLVEWDDSLSNYGEVGGVRVTGLSPRQFIPQPAVTSLEEMEYCFLVFETTSDELSRRFGVAEDVGASFEEGEGEDTVTMVVAFYKNERGLVSRFIWSGERMLSDTDDYYARKTRFCPTCGKSKSLCSCGEERILLASEEYELAKETLMTASGKRIEKGSRLSFYRPKHFPIVIRKNISAEDSCIGQSDCLAIRPQQLEINKILSRVHEKLMMAGVFPYKPDDCHFRYDNSVGGKVLNLRPGETPERFGVLDTTPDISQDLAYIARVYDDAKRILGISDAYVGKDEESSKSGKAREIQVAQSEGRLVSKRVMKNAAYAELDRLIFEMYLAYADEPRAILFRDGYGNVESDAFCRYDFLEYDAAKDAFVYDDGYLFSVASEKPLKDEREPLWQYNLDNYREGGFGEVGKPDTLARYWAAQLYCGYPGARENLAHFSSEASSDRKSPAADEAAV